MQRISFNGGATFWQFETEERLAEIRAFLARKDEPEERSSFAQRCVKATLEAERKMFAD